MIWYRNDSESLQTHCANRNRRQKLYRNKQASYVWWGYLVVGVGARQGPGGPEQVDWTVWILVITLWYLINHPWPWPWPWCRWGSEQVDLTVWILKLTRLHLINYPWPWPWLWYKFPMVDVDGCGSQLCSGGPNSWLQIKLILSLSLALQ
jgi:hypothetical protein